MRSIGMLATSWPWPYAPEGVPKLTKPMIRVDPGDHFDGVGWGKIDVSAQDKVDDRIRDVAQAGVRAVPGGLFQEHSRGPAASDRRQYVAVLREGWS